MKKRSTHTKKMRNWIIKNHAELNSRHDKFLAAGYVFLSGKTRFWTCKDGTVSIRLVYCKNGKAWREEHAILLKMHIGEEQITVYILADNSHIVWSGQFRKAAEDGRL